MLGTDQIPTRLQQILLISIICAEAASQALFVQERHSHWRCHSWLTSVDCPDQAEEVATTGERCQGPCHLKRSPRAGVVIPTSPLLSSIKYLPY